MNSLSNIWLSTLAAALVLSFAGVPAAAQTPAGESRTVLGPRNPALFNGAHALIDGDAERGVALTLEGLQVANGRRERQAALSNLCAGYLMLEQFENAMSYCDLAIEENPRNWRALNNRALVHLRLKRYDESKADLDVAQEIAPNARTLKEARGMLRDEVDPVTPNIVIDDRRDVPDDDDE